MWKEFPMIARSLTIKIILFVAFFPVFLLSFRTLCPAVCREVSGRDEDRGVGGGEVRDGNVFLR